MEKNTRNTRASVGDPRSEEEWVAGLRAVLDRLDEAERRWVAGLLSAQLGWGGDVRVAAASGLHAATVRRGRHEVTAGLPGFPPGRTRRVGAGRPTIEEECPGVEEKLACLVETDTAGDPASGRKWTRRSLRYLAKRLAVELGRPVSYSTVQRLLKKGATRSGSTTNGSRDRHTPTETSSSG
ncbi:hypothetical protein ACFL59_16635, partial [Planctomycetota bacterium]